jgi:hypothetical protein
MGIIEKREERSSKNAHCDKNGVKNCNELLQNTKSTNPFSFLYYCVFVFLCALLLLQVHNTVTNYLEMPTYTSSNLVRQYHAEFPALSICDQNRGFKADILKVLNINILRVSVGFLIISMNYFDFI